MKMKKKSCFVFFRFFHILPSYFLSNILNLNYTRTYNIQSPRRRRETRRFGQISRQSYAVVFYGFNGP